MEDEDIWQAFDRVLKQYPKDIFKDLNMQEKETIHTIKVRTPFALKIIFYLTATLGLIYLAGQLYLMAEKFTYETVRKIKTKIVEDAIAEDMNTHEFEIDNKGTQKLGKDMTRDDLYKALHLCALEQDQMTMQIGMIKDVIDGK